MLMSPVSTSYQQPLSVFLFSRSLEKPLSLISCCPADVERFSSFAYYAPFLSSCTSFLFYYTGRDGETWWWGYPRGTWIYFGHILLMASVCIMYSAPKLTVKAWLHLLPLSLVLINKFKHFTHSFTWSNWSILFRIAFLDFCHKADEFTLPHTSVFWYWWFCLGAQQNYAWNPNFILKDTVV